MQCLVTTRIRKDGCRHGWKTSCTDLVSNEVLETINKQELYPEMNCNGYKEIERWLNRINCKNPLLVKIEGILEILKGLNDGTKEHGKDKKIRFRI